MTGTPLSTVDSSAELRTCLRDLVSLLGLPALWSNREPKATLRLLAETLVEMLSLDVAYVTTSHFSVKEALDFFYANGEVIEAGDATEWAAFIETSSRDNHEFCVGEEASPIGQLKVARFSLGYYGQSGQITVAASRSDFPKPTDLILLRSAASLAASGLRTARLTYERERAVRVKDEFLAMLGHELRNPLAPIVTALDLIRLKGNDTLSPEYAVIERQVKHLKGLVDDLLDITRITSGKIQLQQEVIELHTAFLTGLEAAQPLIKERRHHILCNVPESGLLVNGDSRRLSQVIANLLINAAKYTEPEGQISISAYHDGKYVSLQVKDNGTGIAPDLLPNVFDMFEQGKVSIDRSGGGLGIGLSVVKSLVNLHGGTVAVHSDGVGLGSTFTVTLPLAQETTVALQDQGSPAIHHAKRAERILIVDDNKDAADVMGRLLQAYGYEVHTCYSPLDALMARETIRPTILIVDIGLPVMSGYELAGLMRNRCEDQTLRILAVTGYGQPQDLRRTYDAGIEAHFTKPVQIENLLEIIRKGYSATAHADHSTSS